MCRPWCDVDTLRPRQVGRPYASTMQPEVAVATGAQWPAHKSSFNQFQSIPNSWPSTIVDPSRHVCPHRDRQHEAEWAVVRSPHMCPRRVARSGDGHVERRADDHNRTVSRVPCRFVRKPVDTCKSEGSDYSRNKPWQWMLLRLDQRQTAVQ
ncbi:unnamed protein product [Sphagnum balticum]